MKTPTALLVGRGPRPADTNGHATFIITRTGWSSGGGSPTPSMSSSNLAFHSKENTASQPAPTLTVELVPEPGTPLLLALGALLAGWRRRRAA